MIGFLASGLSFGSEARHVVGAKEGRPTGKSQFFGYTEVQQEGPAGVYKRCTGAYFGEMGQGLGGQAR